MARDDYTDYDDEHLPVAGTAQSRAVTTSSAGKNEQCTSGQALAIGIVADVGGSIITTKLFALSLMVLFGATGFFSSSLYLVWGMIIGLAGVFSGAFLAAHFAPSRPMLHAAVIGLLDLLVSAAMVHPSYWMSFLLVYAVLALPAVYSAGSLARWVAEPAKKRLPGGESPHLLT